MRKRGNARKKLKKVKEQNNERTTGKYNEKK